jgi:hypothetical protein
MFSSTSTKSVFVNGAYSGYVNSNITSYINPTASSIGTNNSSSGGGGGGTGSLVTNANGVPVVLNYYSALSVLCDDIYKILYNYSIGNIDFVNANLTTATYYHFTIQLAKIKQDATIYPEFENIRVTIARALEGVKKAMLVYTNSKNLKTELDIMTQKASILQDITKLTEYINSLAGSVKLFPDIEVTSISATLKPEIAEYIKLFGYPSSGVFESDKLAIALKNVAYNLGHSNTVIIVD